VRKKSILIVLSVVLSHFIQAQAQQPATAPGAAPASPQPEAPYLSNPIVPPFHLLKLDSASYLTKDDLRTLVMFFSPDCEHCRHQTEAILGDFSKFKDIEIVMATYQPFGEMKDFNTHYRLFEHPNIKIGRDEKFFLVPFYRIKNLPYLALYDKEGKLITTFEGTQKIDTLVNAFEKEHTN
jgi:thiol-disulfide isomerase/thioredoxin